MAPPRASGSTKPTRKPFAGQSTLGHLFSEKDDFEKDIAEQERKLGEEFGRLETLRTQLGNITSEQAQQSMNSELERNSSVVDEIFQQQADQITDLTWCLDKRMKTRAPIDEQIATCETQNAVHAMLCDFSNDYKPEERNFSNRLVHDTLEDKVEPLRMLEDARKENDTSKKGVGEASSRREGECQASNIIIKAEIRGTNESLPESEYNRATRLNKTEQDLQAAQHECQKAENGRLREQQDHSLTTQQLATIKARADKLQGEKDSLHEQLLFSKKTVETERKDKYMAIANAKSIELQRQEALREAADKDKQILKLMQQLHVSEMGRAKLQAKQDEIDEDERQREAKRQQGENSLNAGMAAYYAAKSRGKSPVDAMQAFLDTSK